MLSGEAKAMLREMNDWNTNEYMLERGAQRPGFQFSVHSSHPPVEPS
jgi:hypothetical protein